MTGINMREADKVEMAVLVDNYSDFFLEDTEVAKRLRVMPPNGPLAEPGLSYLIKVHAGEETHTLLFDTGISGTCLVHNAQALAMSRAVLMGEVGVKLTDVEAIVLSHGHFDHVGGLMRFFEGSNKELPVIVHESAFFPRRFQINPQVRFDMPGPDEKALREAGAKVERIKGPTVVASGLILVSGEVKRRTDFEKGLPGMEMKFGEEWVPDPFYDDFALAVQIRGRGLVVAAGCSHAGIINTVRHFQKVSGVEKVHAVLGGFHLSGENDKLTEPTVREMKKIGPDHLVPMHCTGWKAINRFAREMPGSFILNSVGTTYVFN